MSFLASYNARSNGGPFTDALIFLLIIILVLLFPFTWTIYQLRRQYSLSSRGFWVAGKGRDPIQYEERRNGRTVTMTIDGEMMAIGPHMVYIPNDEQWRRRMPEWARDRRDEIVANLKRGLGTKRYEFVYSQRDAEQIVGRERREHVS